ncbi:MAG: hypothetical protein WC545_01425 [Patescibacteria group bacterium]
MNDKKETLKKYMELEQRLKEYRKQFMGGGWIGGKFDSSKKALTPKEIEKIKIMEKEVEEARAEYLTAEKIN